MLERFLSSELSMPLSPSPETANTAKPRGRLSIAAFETWNRKLHYYVGLYFLFFLWLFSFTGLLLNHPQWGFAEFWPQRKETRYEKAIEPMSYGNDVDRAEELIRQLNLTGEIDWPDRAQEPGRLDFNVNRPGSTNRVMADFARKRASVQHTAINSWGVMRVLHTFSGVRANNPQARRDWVLTTVWVVSMDALAAGLLIMVLSSYYMWYRMKRKRSFGPIALVAGVLSCSLFVAGLAWLDRLH
ncbi:MAG: hypothetical protein HY000_18480 [Planctomycetes bacterium]|nr:hypothetical protein [Planctomycetota bacterium]